MKPLRSPAAARRGSALIITISMLVLLTVAAVAFFSRATSQRTIENSRANQILAEQLAKTGADYDLGLLLAEIAAGSTASTNNGTVLYRPNAATNAVPRRALAQSTMAADPRFANLLRQSTNGGHNTAAPSQNGRAVGPARWNTPFLLTGGGFTNTNQLAQWIYVLRDGTVAGAPSTNAVGRFACHVYDIGGLLDANAAGYPAAIAPGTTNLAALKGTVAGADLGAIPGVSDANAFVRWRNANSAGSAAAYVAAVTNAATNGFLAPPPGDRNLLSRRDLIRLAEGGNHGLTREALPYLSTFSRALNAPSWGPSTPAGSSVDYAAQQDDAAATNRFLPNVRAVGQFTRADGTRTRPGEPLLKHRFPLSRLAGIGRNGVNSAGATTMTNGTRVPATAATVQRDFGLVWDSANSRWNYAGPSGTGQQSSIKTLAQVAAENREPNFFELLQAAILNGSLGKDLPTNYLNNSQSFDQNRSFQIIQIGANLLDQYDADSYPTKIGFGGNDFAGVENIPYLSRIFTYGYRTRADADHLRGYLCFEFWNPHRPKANTDAPTRFRVAASGRASIYAGSVEDPGKAPVAYGYGIYMPADTQAEYRNTEPLGGSAPGQNGLKSALGVRWRLTDSGQPEFTATASATFAAARSYHNPTLLTPYEGATASGDNLVNDGSTRFVGLYAGKVRCKADTYGNWQGTHWNPCYGGYIDGNPLALYVQYYDGSKWVTYQAPSVRINGFWDGGFNKPAGSTTSPGLFMQGADPRSARFGYGMYHTFAYSGTPPWRDQTYANSIGRTLRPDSSRTTDEIWPQFPYGSFLATYGAHPGWSPPGPSPYDFATHRFGWLAENKSDKPTWYRDPDNILRNGDAAYADGPWGQPLEQINPANGASRAVMLDRPFRSVGEMGYAFRDQPYKSLDFFTANSADAALLDVFCVSEGPVSGVTAGVLNLNTRQQPVVKAVLAGALKDEFDASTPIGSNEAGTLAGAILAATGSAPLGNRAELAGRIGPVLAAGWAGGPGDAAIKARRESVVRALAEAGQTRTWNLMIDVVAQSGRFPSAGSTAAGNFTVEAEARQWVHVALDRYSGQIVARSVETVDE